MKSRIVTVKGPRGTLVKSFRHMTVDIRKIEDNKLLVEKWFGIKKELAAVRTVCSHIENMFKGVQFVRQSSVHMFCMSQRPEIFYIHVYGNLDLKLLQSQGRRTEKNKNKIDLFRFFLK